MPLLTILLFEFSHLVIIIFFVGDGAGYNSIKYTKLTKQESLD